MADTVLHGCRVLDRARARDARFPWVLLAELTDGDGCFARGWVVWYEDASRRRSLGHYTSSRADARAVFERRAVSRAAWRSAQPLAARVFD